MTTPDDHHRSVAARFSECVAAVGAQWDEPTPVVEWRVRDIVGHLVEWFSGFLAAGSGIHLPSGPSIDDDPVGAWDHQCRHVQALLDDPSTAAAVLSNPHIGDVALPEAIDRFYTADVFMHTWDIARAIGHDDTLDEATCAEMLVGMSAMEDILRGSGQFGPRIEVPADASVQDRFIAFLGRDPYWTASAG